MKNRDIQSNIEKIREKKLLLSLKVYDRAYVDRVLIDIFERYS
jgi:hypothetical protein